MNDASLKYTLKSCVHWGQRKCFCTNCERMLVTTINVYLKKYYNCMWNFIGRINMMSNLNL